MKWISALSAIKELIIVLDRLFKWLKLQGVISKLEEAIDDAVKRKDQRLLEKSFGNSGGPSKRKYSGMFTRSSEDSSRDMDD